VQNRTARERSPVNLVALTASARLADAQFAVTSWAGYDGAIENPRVGALVEARLIHRLAIAVGADSSSDEAGAFTLRPWWRCASSNRKK
jgi:hypothetical protein